MAVQFLVRHGAEIVARNVEVGRGEVDVVARVGGVMTAVEVRSLNVDPRSPTIDPVTAFDAVKAEQVRRLASLLRPAVTRVDLVAVAFTAGGVSLRWVPQAA